MFVARRSLSQFFVNLFGFEGVARCVVFDAIVLLRLSNHNGVDLDVSCAPFQIIVVFGVVLSVSLISPASIQMFPAIICFLYADLGCRPYDCRRIDASVLAHAPFPPSVLLHDQLDELRSIHVRN